MSTIPSTLRRRCCSSSQQGCHRKLKDGGMKVGNVYLEGNCQFHRSAIMQHHHEGGHEGGHDGHGHGYPINDESDQYRYGHGHWGGGNTVVIGHSARPWGLPGYGSWGYLGNYATYPFAYPSPFLGGYYPYVAPPIVVAGGVAPVVAATVVA
jgi:hypothetical protein